MSSAGILSDSWAGLVQRGGLEGGAFWARVTAEPRLP